MAFCALGRMCRYDACTKRGQVLGVIQRPGGKPVFCLFFYSPCAARTLIHYTIKYRKIRLHNYCFGSSLSFRPMAARRLSTQARFLTILDAWFSRVSSIFLELSRVSVSPTATATGYLGQCSIATRSRLWTIAARESRESIFRFACMSDIHIVDGRKRSRRRLALAIDCDSTRDKIGEKYLKTSDATAPYFASWQISFPRFREISISRAEISNREHCAYGARLHCNGTTITYICAYTCAHSLYIITVGRVLW